MKLAAQGRYRDPFGAHEDRYFSAGEPTKLVRDAGQESYDPAPALPLAEVLVPAPEADGAVANGMDLHRADEACDAAPYDANKARRAALDVFDQTSAQW